MNPYGFSEELENKIRQICKEVNTITCGQYPYLFAKTEESIGTHHIWMNGPDGHSYHCPICGISKCDDHDGYCTCESWIVHQAEIIKDRTGPLFDVTGRLWKAYLSQS